MIWGSFGTVHLVTLAFAVLFNIFAYLILKRNSRSTQIVTLFLFSLFCVGVLVVKIITSENPIVNSLPLNFWSLNLVLLPIAVLTRKKGICNLLLIWSFSSIVALVFNGNMAHLNVLSLEFLAYYTIHLFGASIPILLFELHLIKRDFKLIKDITIVSVLTYTAVHFINIIINSSMDLSAIDGANYMATMIPNNSLLNFFHAIIPSSYWYMILALPLLLLYMLFWYLPELLDAVRNKPSKNKRKNIEEYYDEYEEEYIDEIIEEEYDD